jgi:hypothetical protein
MRCLEHSNDRSCIADGWTEEYYHVQSYRTLVLVKDNQHQSPLFGLGPLSVRPHYLNGMFLPCFCHQVQTSKGWPHKHSYSQSLDQWILFNVITLFIIQSDKQFLPTTSQFLFIFSFNYWHPVLRYPIFLCKLLKFLFVDHSVVSRDFRLNPLTQNNL